MKFQKKKMDSFFKTFFFASCLTKILIKINFMKKLLSIFTLLLPIITFSQEKGLDEKINDIIKPAVDAMSNVFFYKPLEAFGFDMPLVVLWLVVGATFFTIYMGFINLKGIKHAYQLIRGDYDKPEDEGEVSHFQALVTALSGTVGLGNIAGVAVAISLGGAGATFWMILAGFLGMSSKFVECTLGVKYRRLNDLGEVSGGPMYYLSEGLSKKGFAGLGKVLAVVFAILAVGGSFGGGNMFQANQAFAQVASVEELSFMKEYGALFGVVLAILVGTVIIGGIKSIARVTDKVVPFMVAFYVLFSLIIIGINFSEIGNAFSEILNGAFSPDAAKGGIIGVLIVGFQRAAFSNEAGVGSASIAHSAAKTDEPISEGIVALLEPFVDTVVICTMTALVLIFTGFSNPSSEKYLNHLGKRYDLSNAIINRDAKTINDISFSTTSIREGQRLVLMNAEKGVELYDYQNNQFQRFDKLEGTRLTSVAFTGTFPWFKYVLLVAIILFAFSTMISWSYYGLKSWTYIFGHSQFANYSYKFIFLCFIVVGSASSLGAVIDFSDMMILGMAFPNILGLYFLSAEVRNDLKDYFKRLKSGEIKKYN